MMKSLLIAFGFPVQYRALRCAAAAGMAVYVLGNKDAQLLRFSRDCRRFFPIPDVADRVSSADGDLWVKIIEDALSRCGAAMVIPADARATELLAGIRDRLSVPAYPILSLDKFRFLNDKWKFYQLCRQLNLPTPSTWVFRDKAALLSAIERGELPDSLIAKPLCGSGGIGVVPLTAHDAERGLNAVDYAPILVQEYIDGEHIGLSVFTAKGRVVASTVHQIKGQRFFYKTNDEYLRMGRAIAVRMETDGPMNFDAQLSPDGRIFLLECNPRVFLTMDYAAIAGVNFIAAGLQDWDGAVAVPIATPEVAVRSVLGVAPLLLSPWRIEPADLKMLQFALTDPIPFLIETLRLLWLRISTPPGVRRM
jgi:biotin carboxylase